MLNWIQPKIEVHHDEDGLAGHVRVPMMLMDGPRHPGEAGIAREEAIARMRDAWQAPCPVGSFTGTVTPPKPKPPTKDATSRGEWNAYCRRLENAHKQGDA